MAYCTKCGARLPTVAEFCPSCGRSVSSARGKSTRPEASRRVSREVSRGAPAGMAEKQEKYEKYEKHEKQEKQEKQEKHEKGGAGGSRFGPFMGGFILIWVGVCLFLAFYDYIAWEIFWAYLVAGIGVVLLVVGMLLHRYPEPGTNPAGLLIGGLVMLVIGAFSVVAWQGFGVQFWSSFWSHFWVFVPIIVGVLIIIGALTAMRRSPRP